jgi:hypothetical protein
MMISRRTLLAGVIAYAMIASPIFAHPFHICTGEMEYNAKTKRWEVAMKMHPSDVETAIRKKTGKKVDVAVKEGSPELVEYLSKHFRLLRSETSKGAEKAKLEFTGAEMERGWLWVYFELPAPEGEGAVSLTNTILLDDVEKQSNTMLVKSGGKKASLQFTSEKRVVGSELLSVE